MTGVEGITEMLANQETSRNIADMVVCDGVGWCWVVLDVLDG